LKNKLLLGLIVVLLQCSSPQSFSYTPTDHPEPKVKLGKSIGILPFKDLRPFEDRNRLIFPFAIIPLILWQTIENERPIQYENAEIIEFESKLRHAIQNELESRKVFKEVFLDFPPIAKPIDYKVEIKLYSTKEKRIITMYGLSFLGIYISVLGIPSANVENTLILNVNLIDTKTNQSLFQKKYNEMQNRFFSRHSYDSNKFQNEIDIVQRMFPEIANDIVNAISKK
jgi:TolB-like protein